MTLNAPITTLNAATTGNGTTVDFGEMVSTVDFEILPTGTITAGAVQMQISEDGVNWFTPPIGVFSSMSAATVANPYNVTGAGALFDLAPANLAVRFARANVSTPLTGGGTVTVLITGK